MISFSICLTDLPKEAITTARNGKKYINLIIAPRQQPDQYENTHTVFVSQTKDERAARKPKQYVGNGKELQTNNRSYGNNYSSQDDNSDLPF